MLTSVVSLISKRKVWRSSDSVRNIFISSGVPTWKQALEAWAFSSSISFWKCAICKVKKKVQPLKHSRVWNKSHRSCFYNTIKTSDFTGKAGNSCTATGRIPHFSRTAIEIKDDWTGHTNRLTILWKISILIPKLLKDLIKIHVNWKEMVVPLYSGLPASKMKKMLEEVLTSSLIPAMTGSESFHWWTCFSKAALGTADLPWRKKTNNLTPILRI